LTKRRQQQEKRRRNQPMGRKRRRDQPMGRKCSRYSWHKSRRWLRPNRQAMKRSDLASKKKESDEK